MNKIWMSICGLALVFLAGMLALMSPEKIMAGELYPYMIVQPRIFILVAWRLVVIPLALVIGTALISESILVKTRLSVILICWAIIYFGYIVWRYRTGNILLIQYFRFNHWQDYLFLLLLNSYAGFLLPYIFNSARRNDVICLGIGISGMVLLNLSGWWSGPQGFEIGSPPQTILFALLWLFIILMILSPLGLIFNIIRNLFLERKDWKYV